MTEEVSEMMEEKEEEMDDAASEDGSESSVEDVEPMLKYERVGNNLTGIFSKDAASCMTVHPKFIAMGTHWGFIHVLDHLGNTIKTLQSVKTPAHTTTVNQISIDACGDHLASCSDDGRVLITALYSAGGVANDGAGGEELQRAQLNRPVKAVAVDPNFKGQGSANAFVTGDDKLILNEKGFFSRHKQTILHQGEGPIRTIKWRGPFIAWANDKGVKVYDMTAQKKITYIEKEHKLRPELYGCNLYWKDETTLLTDGVTV